MLLHHESTRLVNTPVHQKMIKDVQKRLKKLNSEHKIENIEENNAWMDFVNLLKKMFTGCFDDNL